MFRIGWSHCKPLKQKNWRVNLISFDQVVETDLHLVTYITAVKAQALCNSFLDQLNYLWQFFELNSGCYLISGPDNSFVTIYKGRETSLTIDKTTANLPVGKQVQFRACAINLIGEGPWGFPYGIKIPEWRVFLLVYKQCWVMPISHH